MIEKEKKKNSPRLEMLTFLFKKKSASQLKTKILTKNYQNQNIKKKVKMICVILTCILKFKLIYIFFSFKNYLKQKGINFVFKLNCLLKIKKTIFFCFSSAVVKKKGGRNKEKKV